ncbi:stability determinant [Sphingomonas suaedae]|uniref:Stability determinant n=1 Tax=Sphingomonas suaedae TaxID=2599297 RepID=A0A518RDE1_9SPHN|nr:stability determinant [Sphingomonas suaedae]QDX25488.1 stability determinant [Sphingomonas suaedae]
MGKLDPIVSEFETEEDAQAYDTWFRAQVEAGLASTKPRIPHDEVMARIREILDGKRRAGPPLGS